ncbi:MAG: PRC-barrel domain-containing protein [Methylocella sp.]
MSALTLVTPILAFQDVALAAAGSVAQTAPAQPAQAEPQPAPSQPVPPPEPQTAPAPPPTPSANNPAAAPAATDEKDKEKQGTPATVVDGQQLDSILGKNVLSLTGEDMGRIVDVIVDRTGQARAVIIDFGGFLGVGTRKIAVDWGMIRFPSNGKMDNVIMDLSRNQLRVAPIFKPGDPVVIVGRPAAAQVAAPAPVAAPAVAPAAISPPPEEPPVPK